MLLPGSSYGSEKLAAQEVEHTAPAPASYEDHSPPTQRETHAKLLELKIKV